MRLEITRRTDLATRALLELERLGRRTKSAELAERVGTTPGFLSQAMAAPVAAGWVRSDPGPTGGYLLVADLAEVSMLDVIEATEGPTEGGRCVLEDRDCADGSICALHQAWARARAVLTQQLAESPLSSLVAS